MNHDNAPEMATAVIYVKKNRTEIPIGLSPLTTKTYLPNGIRYSASEPLVFKVCTSIEDVKDIVIRYFLPIPFTTIAPCKIKEYSTASPYRPGETLTIEGLSVDLTW